LGLSQVCEEVSRLLLLFFPLFYFILFLYDFYVELIILLFFCFQSKSANVLAVLGAVASEALDLTGFYYSGKPTIAKRRGKKISRTSTGRYVFFTKLIDLYPLKNLRCSYDSKTLLTFCLSFWLQSRIG
jgi:hypothetical protein